MSDTVTTIIDRGRLTDPHDHCCLLRLQFQTLISSRAGVLNDLVLAFNPPAKGETEASLALCNGGGDYFLMSGACLVHREATLAYH